MSFDEWLFKMCEHKAKLLRKDPTEIFSSTDLYDAKLSFYDGVAPEDYTTW